MMLNLSTYNVLSKRCSKPKPKFTQVTCILRGKHAIFMIQTALVLLSTQGKTTVSYDETI